MKKQWWLRGTLLVFLISAAAASLRAADWPMYKQDPIHSGWIKEEVSMPPALLWRYSTEYFQNLVSTPIVVGQTVYFVCKDKLYALDAATGSLNWRYPAEGALEGIVRGTPAAADGVIYFGDSTGKIYAVKDEGRSGRLLWAYPLESKQAIRSPLTIVDGVIYFGADDNAVHALDIRESSPKPYWRQPITVGDDVSLPVVVLGDLLYFTSADQNLYAASLTTGRLRRSMRFPYATTYSQPLIEENSLFIASGNLVYCLQPRSFVSRWFLQMPAEVTAIPAVANGTLYIVCKDRKLYAITTAQHTLKWTASLDVTSNSSPVVAGNVVLLGAEKGFIYAFDAETGQLKWRGRTRATRDLEDQYTSFSVMTSPVVANNMIFVLPEDGSLNAFSPAAVDTQAPVVSDFVPAPGTTMSGMPPITISAKMMDEGSGINDGSISFMLDGQDLPRVPEIKSFRRRAQEEDGYTLKMETGVLAYETPVQKPAVPLKDGLHTVTLKVTDWKGNTTTAEWTFIVDNRLPPVRRKPRTERQREGMPGMGGQGGMPGIGTGRTGSRRGGYGTGTRGSSRRERRGGYGAGGY